MITTTAFVRMGKVYENMMVDLMATSQKLVERSRRTVMTVTGVRLRDRAPARSRRRARASRPRS